MSLPRRLAAPVPDQLHWFDGRPTCCPVLRFIAYHRMRRHTTIPLYRVGTLHLALVAGGTLNLRIDGKATRVSAGSAAILRPGVEFTHDAAPNAGEVYYVGLSLAAQSLAGAPQPLRAALQALRGRLSSCGNVVAIDDALLAAAAGCFDAVRSEAPLLTRHARAWSLIGQLAECVAAGAPPAPAPRLVQPALELLLHRLPHAPSITELAAACAMRRSRFLEVFRHELGLPPHEWITRRRIELAAEKLGDSRATVTSVALSVGFATPQHFSTLFKRFMGVSPQQYRGRR